MQIDIDDGKKDLAHLLSLLETGQEEDIFLTQQGNPIIKMSRLRMGAGSRRFGIAKGMLEVPDDLDKYNDEIAEMFGVKE